MNEQWRTKKVVTKDGIQKGRRPRLRGCGSTLNSPDLPWKAQCRILGLWLGLVASSWRAAGVSRTPAAQRSTKGAAGNALVLTRPRDYCGWACSAALGLLAERGACRRQRYRYLRAFMTMGKRPMAARNARYIVRLPWAPRRPDWKRPGHAPLLRGEGHVQLVLGDDESRDRCVMWKAKDAQRSWLRR